MNVFFAINKKLAELMKSFPEYNVSILEKHHLDKKDSPSGTAMSLAETIMYNSNKKDIINRYTESKESLGITSIREGKVSGYHQITYKNEIDEIQISHNAFSRKGFAKGAVMAAEWIENKKGFYTIDSIFNF